MNKVNILFTIPLNTAAMTHQQCFVQVLENPT